MRYQLLAFALGVLGLCIAVACCPGCGAAGTALGAVETARGVTCLACRKFHDLGICPDPVVELGRPDGGPAR